MRGVGEGEGCGICTTRLRPLLCHSSPSRGSECSRPRHLPVESGVPSSCQIDCALQRLLIMSERSPSQGRRKLEKKDEREGGGGGGSVGVRWEGCGI